MTSTSDEVILCCVQDSPVSFDLQASLDKLSRLARQAAAKARATASSPDVPIVVLFPEAFLSAYPRGLDFGAKIGHRTAEGRSWFARYHGSSVPVCDTEGLEMTAIRNVAKENGITLVVGVIERCDRPETGKKREEYGSSVAGGSGTIYCTAITISEAGEVVASHRKLMPTGTERLVWGQGDGQGIRVAPTRAGKVGAVICWEVSDFLSSSKSCTSYRTLTSSLFAFFARRTTCPYFEQQCMSAVSRSTAHLPPTVDPLGPQACNISRWKADALSSRATNSTRAPTSPRTIRH